MTTQEILLSAKSAVKQASTLSTEKKNEALSAMAKAILRETDTILQANKQDIDAVKDTMNSVMLDRLTLTEQRIQGMAKGIEEVVLLPDPVGRVLETVIRPNGLVIKKTAVPMGVIAMIYESRPNVTSDAAALTLKSGNVSVLRSGKEAIRSSLAIVNAMRRGLKQIGLSENLVNLLEDTSRESANTLMTAVGLVDLLIPRGGAGLIKACVENAKVPCIQTGTGICHIFADETADLEQAVQIVNNAKTQRPSVCNAQEVLLIHENIADKLLPMIKNELVDKRVANGLTPVKLLLCEKSAAIIDGEKAGDNDFDTEFLNYILAVKIVDSVTSAIEHIAEHSTHHSDCILTQNRENAELFEALVDSAAVYVNASTRFTDGGEFGLGCEIGISTQKLHARGPMGLNELCTYKYIVEGNGQIRV